MTLAVRPAEQHTSAPEMLALYQIEAADLDRIRSFGEFVVPRLDEYVRQFYAWMETQPEFGQFFSDTQKLARVQREQVGYWREFFAATVDHDYMGNRRAVGEAHARIGLSIQAYLAAMNVSLRLLTESVYDGDKSHDEYARSVHAVNKLMHLDTAIVVQTFTIRVNQLLAEQNDALMQMSTPVTTIWDGILLLPIVGIIDSRRAQDIMNTMLAKVAESQARVAILDISGVGVVDTAVANHLIKITKATRLMGCETTISGISPPIAQTVVELGIDVGDVLTTATLQDALALAFQATGVEMHRSAQSSRVTHFS